MILHPFRVLCEDAGIETRPYSGRAMHGEKCLGIDTNNLMGTIAELIEAAIDWVADPIIVADALRRSKTDSMGLGTILYFPHIPWNEFEDERNTT